MMYHDPMKFDGIKVALVIIFGICCFGSGMMTAMHFALQEIPFM